jgi:hypothetical protein
LGGRPVSGFASSPAGCAEPGNQGALAAARAAEEQQPLGRREHLGDGPALTQARTEPDLAVLPGLDEGVGDVQRDEDRLQLLGDPVGGLEPSKFDAAVTLRQPPSVVLFQRGEDGGRVAGLPGDHQVTLLGTADLEAQHGLEAVVEAGLGPVAGETLQVSGDHRRDLDRAAGGQGGREPVARPRPAVLDDHRWDGRVRRHGDSDRLEDGGNRRLVQARLQLVENRTRIAVPCGA